MPQEIPNNKEDGSLSAHKNPDALREQLTRLTWGSRVLSQKDKRATLEWLSNGEENRDAAALQLRIDHFPEAERSVEKQVAEYSKQLKKAAQEGILAEKSIKPYEEWFWKKLSYEERAAYLKGEKKTELDNEERKKVLARYKKLPHVVRGQLKEKFLKADLQERQKIIDGAEATHQKLKADFLRLPPEMQEKYREQFKEGGFADRASLLSALTITGGPEKNDAARLDAAFKQKTAKYLDQNLITAESKFAYDLWYEALPVEQKQTMAGNSELDTRMGDRVRVRDTFYALPEEARAKHELKFRNADLDKREVILAEIRGGKNGGEAARGLKRPKQMVQDMMHRILDEPSLHEARLIYTILKESQIMRWRAERATSARQTEDIVRKTDEKGYDVDARHVIDFEDLKNHGETRHHEGKFLRRKKALGVDAKLTNTELRDRNHQKVTAEQFKTLVVDRNREELLARIIAKTAERLPGADTPQLRAVAQSLELALELSKAVA